MCTTAPGEAALAQTSVAFHPASLGRCAGLGPDAARTLARWLLSVGGKRRLTVDPYLTNEVAVRGWEKAGFRPVDRREADQEHTAPWLLMVIEGG